MAEWERNQDIIPKRKHLSRLANVFDVSIDYLLGINKKYEKSEEREYEINSKEFRWREEFKNQKEITFKIADALNAFSIEELLAHFKLVDNGVYLCP